MLATQDNAREMILKLELNGGTIVDNKVVIVMVVIAKTIS